MTKKPNNQFSEMQIKITPGRLARLESQTQYQRAGR